jgi:hypothetical protein
MMAWILVSLLASFASDAVVDLSPETNVAPPVMEYGNDPVPPRP